MDSGIKTDFGAPQNTWVDQLCNFYPPEKRKHIVVSEYELQTKSQEDSLGIASVHSFPDASHVVDSMDISAFRKATAAASTLVLLPPK